MEWIHMQSVSYDTDHIWEGKLIKIHIWGYVQATLWIMRRIAF